MTTRLRVRILKDNPFGYGPRLIPYLEHPNGTFSAASLNFSEVPKGAPITTDMGISLDEEASQEILDQLWVCGFRPSKNLDGREQTKAIENHLASTLDQVNYLRDLIDMLIPAVIPPQIQVVDKTGGSK